VINMEGMFAGASSFNYDLSNWDVGRVTNMFEMFFNATRLNQNLCPWGPKLPAAFIYGTSAADKLFTDSGCPDTSNPAGPTGPWCKATCP
jgi:surface protein